MVDFIKLLWRDKTLYEQFLLDENKFPDLKASMSYHTGVIEYPYKDNLEHFVVGVSARQGYLKNSIHKDYNSRLLGEEHNYNDFSYSNLCESIDYLSKTIPCLLPMSHLEFSVVNIGSKLTQLEFGLNINMGNLNVTDFINNQVLMHNYKSHDVFKTFNGRGTYKQFNHSEYAVKIYDKGKQFNLMSNILRFEIRFHKSRALEKLGIFKLTDLKNKHKLRLLFLELLKRFDEMLIVDDVTNLRLTYQQYCLLTRFKSAEYWQFQRASRSRMTISRNKNKCQEFLTQLNINQSKYLLKNKIMRKYSELINF